MHQALQATCPHCGASFPVDARSPQVCCPHCGHQYRSAQVEAAAAYGREAGSLQAQVDHHHRAAARLQQHHERLSPAVGGMGCVLFGLPFVVGTVVVTHVFGRLVLPAEVAVPLPGVVALFAIVTLLFATAVTSPRRRRAGAPAPATGTVVRVSCPTCGGPATLRYGEPVGACGFCGAALVPGETARAAFLDAGRSAEWQARLAPRREERRHALQVGSAGSRGFPVIVVVLLFAVPLVVVSILVPQAMREPGLRLLFLSGWILMVCSVSFWVVWVLRRRAKLQALDQGLRDVALQLRGESSRRFADALAWLNQYWCESLSPRFLGDHPTFGFVHARVAGLRCYADVYCERPDPAAEPRALVLVSALMPVTSFEAAKQFTNPALSPFVTTIQGLGYTIEVEDGGVQVERDGRIYYRHPARVRELATVLNHASHLAVVLGGRPPPCE